jgi:hypothetical protein
MKTLADVIEVRRMCMRHTNYKMFADVTMAAYSTLTLVLNNSLIERVEQLALTIVRTLAP